MINDLKFIGKKITKSKLKEQMRQCIYISSGTAQTLAKP
jgi:hypothetical protein